jgi:chitodextrinase
MRAVKPILTLVLVCSYPAFAASYSTNFPLTENPISEGGKWINGNTVGLKWSNVSTTPGLAIGSDAGTGAYDDATALLTGTWGPDQTVQATLYDFNPNNGIFEEVELRLRSSLSANSCTGYEIMFSCKTNGNQYIEVARWNGPFQSYAIIGGANNPPILKTGDVLKASIVGNVITAWVNGVQVLQCTDSTYANGSPGIGYNGGCTGFYSNFGFTSFSATDGTSLPPAITTQPASQTVSSGQTATFNVVATGTAPLSYQWQKNGANITGATSASYTTPAATTADSGSTFRVIVSNSLGSVTSNSATLTVTPPDSTPPSVPTNLTASAASSTQVNLSWSASTDNVGVAGYKIFRGGAQIATSVTNSYSDTGLSATTTYTYTVSAYDLAGNNSAQSSAASATTPAGQSWAFVQGNSANSAAAANAITFNTTTKAGDLLVVEVNWINSANFVSIADSQGNVFTQIGTEQNSTGVGVKARLYYAKNIKGGADTVTTTISGTVAYHELYIQEYSGLDTVNPLDGFSVNFSSGSSFTSNNVTTTASNDLLFGSEIDSGKGTAASGWSVRSTLDGDVAADRNASLAGSYTFTGTSSGAAVTWIAAFKQAGGSSITPPAITAQPANVTVTAGQSATFSVTATGTAPLAYQWQKNGTNITGATSSSYTTPATTNADNSSIFRVVVSNAGGSVTSNAATLTVNNVVPAITSPASASPSSQIVGQSIMFSAAASDSDGDTLTYSWNFGDSTTASGASKLHSYGTAGTYTATVTISDGHGGSITSSVTVTVLAATAVNSGGGAVGAFSADQGFAGGSTYATSSAINTSGVTNPAPQAVYQSERYGNFTYTFSSLTAGASYTVRLHFAEIWWSAAGKRVFNVAINGQQVLSNFDIYATAGGKFIAIVKEFAATASASGQIVIKYSTVVDNAKSSGIEVLSAGAPAVAASAVSAPTDSSIEGIDLGTAQVGHLFKIKLDAPEGGKKAKLSWVVVDRSQLPPGVTVKGGFIGGRPRKSGSYTFQLQIKGKSNSATNTYTLTITP